MKIWIVAGALGLSTAGLFAQSNDALDSAKSLYLSASYQEALTALDSVKSDGAAADEAAKYQALCLLGLNRQQDAEQAIEQLVTRRPLFKLDPFDSPKLQAMFTEVRAKVLPTAATQLYERAKGAFDRGDLTAAADQFATVLTLLAQPEIASQPSAGDLKLLANGFANLIDQQITLQKQAAVAKAAAAAPPPPAAVVDQIFDDRDTDVIPPVAIEQQIPSWVPPSQFVGAQTFKGTIEIVIDEQGAVASAAMTQPTILPYDQLLLSAAKHWRYRPASRRAQPVKYRKSIAVTLRPTGSIPKPD